MISPSHCADFTVEKIFLKVQIFEKIETNKMLKISSQ